MVSSDGTIPVGFLMMVAIVVAIFGVATWLDRREREREQRRQTALIAALDEMEAKWERERVAASTPQDTYCPQCWDTSYPEPDALPALCILHAAVLVANLNPRARGEINEILRNCGLA